MEGHGNFIQERNSVEYEGSWQIKVDSVNKTEIWQNRNQKPNYRSKFSVPITINKTMILISKIKYINKRSWSWVYVLTH